MSDYSSLDWLESTRLLYRDMGLTATQGTPPVLVPMGRGVGGTTLINLGTALRMDENLFDHWRMAGVGSLCFAELEEAYERVEEFMPLNRLPDTLIGTSSRILAGAIEARGYPVEWLTRHARNCQASGRCYVGCPVDAKLSVNLTCIPDALARGARLVTRCRVDRIRTRAQAVSGVEGRAVRPDGSVGPRISIRADRVVVACGALLSPVLLSRSGITSKATGANLGCHPACRAIGLMDRTIDAHRAVPQSFHALVPGGREIYLETAFLSPGLMAAALPGFGPEHHERVSLYRNLAVMGFRIVETDRGRINHHLGGWPLARYELSPHDLESIRQGLEISAHVLFDAGAREVYIPVAGHEVLRGRDDITEALGSAPPAGRLELSGYHLHGSLRMGENDAISVVDPRGRHHGVPGLWVADASVFATSSRVNPQHTVMALATLVARDVAASWETRRSRGRDAQGKGSHRRSPVPGPDHALGEDG